MEQMTTLRGLVGQAIQKKEEEKRIAEEQAAKDRYLKIPICYDDHEDAIPLQSHPFYQSRNPITLLVWGTSILTPFQQRNRTKKGYLRKARKMKPKQQNRARNGKA
ncbi:hypothetical protein Tco_0234846 [Tanacetum coccineum]